MNFFKRKCFFVSALAVIFGLSNRLGAEQWQARHNLTPAQFQSTFDELFKQGYRLKQISGYESGGSERYAGLWVKDGGPAFYAQEFQPRITRNTLTIMRSRVFGLPG
jgi:hypothetical protein